MNTFASLFHVRFSCDLCRYKELARRTRRTSVRSAQENRVSHVTVRALQAVSEKHPRAMFLDQGSNTRVAEGMPGSSYTSQKKRTRHIPQRDRVKVFGHREQIG